jgi:uncharacterized protein (TIGR02270 family)
VTAPFGDLFDESLHEATFLWGRWEQELASLTRSLDEIYSWTEDRLHGALDGVRVAGAGMLDLVSPGLHADDRRQVAVCAALIGSSDGDGAITGIVDALRNADGIRLEAMLRGLELAGTAPVLRAAAKVLLERGPRYAGGLCRLKAFRRVVAGDEIASAFRSGDVAAQVAALQAASYTTAPQARTCLTDGMDSTNAIVSATAVERGIASGLREAWEAARARAARLDERAAPYLKMVALLGSGDDQEVIFSALRLPSLRLTALAALGHLGTPAAVEACIAGMKHEDLARAAGEAYCWITGAELERDRLAVATPPADVPPFEEDDLDADLVPAPEALWPVPDSEAVATHWQGVRSGFAVGVRHIHGRPVGNETLMAMVESGPMIRRPDLIFELRARSRGRYDVEPRAFADRQRQMMAAARRAVMTEAV